MYIKDLQSGEVRKYGLNHHDALRVSRDGTILSYENLQNGDGSRFGDYRFCDKDGLIPEEDEVLVKYGADAYFNIGGFVEKVMYQDAEQRWIPCSDLISRQDAIEAVDVKCLHRGIVKGIQGIIEDLSSAEPERKKGHWIKISPANIYECSECGKNVMTDDISAYDFCHGCGAYMRGEES